MLTRLAHSASHAEVTPIDATTASQIERLTTEHALLTRRQYEALQKSSYFRLPPREADAYDNRLCRIVEIRRLLEKFRAERNVF
jgi:hypothetical protein